MINELKALHGQRATFIVPQEGGGATCFSAEVRVDDDEVALINLREQPVSLFAGEPVASTSGREVRTYFGGAPVRLGEDGRLELLGREPEEARPKGLWTTPGEII